MYMSLTTKLVQAWLMTLYKLKWTINDHNDCLLIDVFMLQCIGGVLMSVIVVGCRSRSVVVEFRMFRALPGAKWHCRLSDIELYIAHQRHVLLLQVL